MKAKTPKKTTQQARKSKPNDPAQYERFRQAARELGTDESEETFDRAFRQIVPPKQQKP